MQVGIVDERTTRELRRAVLRPHLGPDDPLPGDELAGGGVHVGATTADGTVAGTCFVYPDPCPWLPASTAAWRLRQMATAPDLQGRGVGRAVLAAAVEHVRTQGADVLWCNARETAAGFYERNGFRRYGAVFTDERHPIPHVRMWRELPAGAGSS